MRFEPHDYQRYCIERIIGQPAIALFLDMGLGKTVITLTALQDLKFNRWQTCKALVIAPKKVAEATWQVEAQKWDHLQSLRFSTILGDAAARKAAATADADVYVINRENVPWLVELFGRDWPFDTVVLDESSSFKNHRAKRFRALRTVRPRIRRIIELTGTPDPHGLTDLWAQMFLLDGGQALGRTITVYRDAFFAPDRRNRTTIFSYAPLPGAEEAIREAIAPLCVSLKAADLLEWPEMITDDIPVVLDPASARKYKQFEREAVMDIDDETALTANNAAALSGKLLQMCNGAVYTDTHDAIEIHQCKIDALLETVEQLGTEHALVCYYFQSDLARILPALQATGRRVRLYKGQQDQIDWNAGKIDLLLVHPASCGYGLNLQDGGHHVIWFSLTWNLEEYLQTNKRLHRQGQTHPVIVHHLIVQGGRDEDVIRSLAEKDKAQDALLESLQARIREAKTNEGGLTA